jgi:hypothetical protein
LQVECDLVQALLSLLLLTLDLGQGRVDHLQALLDQVQAVVERL